MTKNVKILLDLQDILTRSRLVEDEKQKIPLEVADLKALFAEKEAKLNSLKEEYERLRNDKREKEREIEEEREKVERAKSKLMAIKTNKEYFAMLKEIESTKRNNAAREEELLSVIARYEEVEKDVAELSAEVEELGGRYRERMVDVEARMASFDKDISHLHAKKADVAKQLDKSLARRFEMIFERRDGVAIVPAKNQSCTGCHMNISPQLYILLQREDGIYSCPTCSRILYYEGEEAEQASG